MVDNKKETQETIFKQLIINTLPALKTIISLTCCNNILHFSHIWQNI